MWGTKNDKFSLIIIITRSNLHNNRATEAQKIKF